MKRFRNVLIELAAYTLLGGVIGLFGMAIISFVEWNNEFTIAGKYIRGLMVGGLLFGLGRVALMLKHNNI